MKLAPVDFWLFALPLLLMGIGLFNLYSIENAPAVWNWGNAFYKQLVWAFLAALGMLLFSFLEGNLWRYMAPLAYIGGVGLMTLTVFIGREVNGAKAWLELGGLRLQPSEFMKVLAALMLARVASPPDFKWSRGRDRLSVLAIVGLPALLALLQRDTGTALTYGALVIPLYRIGLSGWFIVLPLVAGLMALGSLKYPWPVWAGVGLVVGLLWHLFWRKGWWPVLLITLAAGLWAWAVPKLYQHVLAPHQRQRIEVLFDPYRDPRGAGWNVIQARIAIEAGGLWGRGYGQGLQSKLDFIPQRHTDFAFCSLAEEWGWAGSTAYILLYMGFLWYLLWISERTGNRFALVYGYSLAGFLGLHLVINVGMILGLLPVIGIPLTFLSYGGSSWVAMAAGIGILQRWYRERTLRLFS